MTLSATNESPKLIGGKTRQLAQIQSVMVLVDVLANDLENLTVKSTGHIPDEHKPIVLESITALNTALVMLYETIQGG